MAAPMDLNVPYCDKPLLKEKIKMAFQLGYEAVAINVIMPELTKKKEKKKDSGEQILDPEKIKLTDQELKELIGPTRKPFRQLARISAVLEDPAKNAIIKADDVVKYDIIAVQPLNEKTFHQACIQMNVDIITIDVTGKLDFRLKRSTILAAMERGIMFELQYGAAIRNSTLRRYFISNGQKLNFWGKGRNVILTSGCEKAIELRGPYDVANLGVLLNLNQNQCKDAVTNNCRALLAHAESFRLHKSVCKVEKVSDLPASEAWLAEKTDIDSVCNEKKSNSNAPGQTAKRQKQGWKDKGRGEQALDIHRLDSSDDEQPVKKKMKLGQT